MVRPAGLRHVRGRAGKTVLPTTDPSVSLLLSLGTFALAWLVRPIGAVVIGAYGDRAGRKPALVLSAGLMMAGTLLTGALPPMHRSVSPRRC